MAESEAVSTRRSSRPQRKRMYIDTYEQLGRDEEKQLSAALKASLQESVSESSEKPEKDPPRDFRKTRGRHKASKAEAEEKKEEEVKEEAPSKESDTKDNVKSKRKKTIIRQKSISGEPLSVRPQRKFASVAANGKKPPAKRKATLKPAPSLPLAEDSDDNPKTEEFVDYLCLRKTVPSKPEWKQFSGDEDSLVIAESEESTAEEGEDLSIFDFNETAQTTEQQTNKTKPTSASPSRPRRNNASKRRRITQNYYNAKLNSTDNTDNSALVSAPVFRPTGEEFKNFHAYLSKIMPQVLAAGMCKVIPPLAWKPNQVLQEDLRFHMKQQEVHRICHRSGPSSAVLKQIKAHLIFDHGFEWKAPPQIGSVIVDLTRFSWLMKKQGGLQVVIDKHKWSKIGDALGIPNVAERNEQLEDVYCKYLLSYDLLTDEQKENLKTDEVEVSNEIVDSGKKMTLQALRRHDAHARKVKFLPDGVASATSLELEFWNIVCSAEEHVVSPRGTESTTTHGSGFPAYEPRHIAQSDWNLTNLRNLPDGIMGFLPDVQFVTQPRLEFCSLFSVSGWHVQPHFLPLISYNHFNHPRIWYASPAAESRKLLSTLHDLVPRLVNGNDILDPNCVLVPPAEFSGCGINVCRAVQKPGEFIITAPKAYISHFSLGLNVNESVNFATEEWLRYSSESLDLYQNWKLKPPLNITQIILEVIKRHDTLNETSLRAVEPYLTTILKSELEMRKNMSLPCVPAALPESAKVHCETCQTICHLSLVRPGKPGDKMKDKKSRVFCLKHASHLANGVVEYRMSDVAVRRLLTTLEKRLHPIQSIVHPVQSLARSVSRPQMTPSPITAKMENTARQLTPEPDNAAAASPVCPASPAEAVARETDKGLHLVIPSRPLSQCGGMPPSPTYTNTPITPLPKPIPIKPSLKSPIIPSLMVRPQQNYFGLRPDLALLDLQRSAVDTPRPALWECYQPDMPNTMDT